MDINEIKLASEIKYEGRIINLRQDDVKLPNGRVVKRDVVEHPGGVGIVALDDDDNIFLVTQFRTGVYQELTEIPAGKLEYGEDPLTCGMRELQEETGYTAKEFVSLGYIIPTPAYCEEKIYIYLATNLTKASQNLDDDEFLNVSKMPILEAKQKAIDNTFTDAKTVAGILRACAVLNK